MNIINRLPEDIIKKIIIDYDLKERNGFFTVQIEKKRIIFFEELYNLIPKYFTTNFLQETSLVIKIKNTRKRFLFGSSYERTGYIYKIYENGTILASCL